MDTTTSISVINNPVFTVAGIKVDWGHIALASAVILLAVR